MYVIVVVDDSYGMMFNNRRLSKDKKLREKLLQKISGKVFRMNAYTASQFNDVSPNLAKIIVDEDFLHHTEWGEFCFVEDKEILPFLDKIEEVWLCRWNRKYPSDFKLDMIPEQYGFILGASDDFEGSSHKQITIERWMKE